MLVYGQVARGILRAPCVYHVRLAHGLPLAHRLAFLALQELGPQD